MRKAIVLILCACLLLTACDAPPTASGIEVKVYYEGPGSRVKSALELSNEIILVSAPQDADVLVLNGEIGDPQQYMELVQGGAGLVLLFGPGIDDEEISTLLDEPVALETLSEPLSLAVAPGYEDALTTEIVWNSAPQVRERASLHSPVLTFGKLVVGYEDGSLILGVTRIGEGQTYVFTPYMDGANTQFQDWAYFNYLIYHLSLRAAGKTPLPYARYSGAPIPHPQERNVLLMLLGGMVALSFTAFALVRRYSRAHPEALNELVGQRQVFETRQAQSEWEEIGFHRPLGGFLLALMSGLVLFIPLIIYQNLILPVYILPSAQALGIWGRVTQFFNLFWLFLDMGTSAAFVKFFSEYRIHDPRKAIQYGQVFVWWQMLSGALQVAAFILLSSTVLPKTAYAIYAWSIIVHAVIQIPGFFQLMRHGLMAWQRFDYAQILDVALAALFPILTQPILVGVMVWWGEHNPVFGGAMGGLIGLGLAAYLAEALTFIVGLWLYKRLGYNARLLFLAHFDWRMIRDAFRFGSFEMLGSVAWALGQAMEILVTQTRLVNYAEIWGNWVLAQNFIFAFSVISTLENNLMPAISEAVTAARRVLAQYYAVMGYKWGGITSAFIGAVLLAVADRFILGASGAEFGRAALYAIPLICWGAIQYPSWVADNVQLGCNRPYLKSALVAGEQAIRIGLVYLLVEQYQINALIIAYFIGLLTKNIVAYWINHKLCFPQRFYFWQSLGAPLLAAAAHFAIIRLVTGWIWRADQVTSILIFLIGILFSYPLYAFFYGLFGGWDENTLAELRRSVGLSGFIRPMAWLFWASTRLGARLSPLHNRFPVTIYETARAEALALMKERVHI